MPNAPCLIWKTITVTSINLSFLPIQNHENFTLRAYATRLISLFLVPIHNELAVMRDTLDSPYFLASLSFTFQAKVAWCICNRLRNAGRYPTSKSTWDFFNWASQNERRYEHYLKRRDALLRLFFATTRGPKIMNRRMQSRWAVSLQSLRGRTVNVGKQNARETF